MNKIICKLFGHEFIGLFKLSNIHEYMSTCNRCKDTYKITYIYWGELLTGYVVEKYE